MAARVKGGYRCPRCEETKPPGAFYVAKGSQGIRVEFEPVEAESR